MITLTETIQCYIRNESTSIHQLKISALTCERLKKFAFISPDGKQYRNRLADDAQTQAGWRWGEIEYERICNHISPKHLQWQQYQRAKQRVSLLLTARLILKLGNETLPSFQLVSRAIKAHRLAHHSSRKSAGKALIIKAFRYLRKLDNRLKARPEKFAELAEQLDKQRQLQSWEGERG